MYEPELTIQGALEELGPPVRLAEWRLGPEHIYVAAYKRRRELIDKGFEQGWLFDERLTIDSGDLKFTEPATREFRSALRRAYRDGDGWFKEDPQGPFAFCFNVHRQENDDLCHYTCTRWKDAFDEQLINGVEHGSDWCTAGEIVVRAAYSPEGAFAVIDQPKAGPSDEIRQRLGRVGNFKDFFRAHKNRERRGAGLANAFHDVSPRVNFEDLKNGGCRTMLLATSACDVARYNKRLEILRSLDQFLRADH